MILAKHFIDEFARQNRLGSIGLSHEAKDKLLRYGYPGNVRELKSVIELAVVMCDGNEISAEDITFNSIRREENLMKDVKTLREYTIAIIAHYLKNNNNDVVLAAKILDIGKSTIYKMIKDGELKI